MSTLKRNRRPTTPGEFLKEDYLKPRGIKIAEMAEAIDLSTKHFSQIVNGHQRITPTTAMKVAKVLGTTSRIWLNMQAAVDAWDADQEAKNWKPKRVFEAA